jgi:hypothetical protein
MVLKMNDGLLDWTQVRILIKTFFLFPKLQSQNSKFTNSTKSYKIPSFSGHLFEMAQLMQR